jgi:hypothetical protein
VDCEERTIWIPDAQRDDGRHFIVRADELLTAFVELELAVKSRKIKYLRQISALTSWGDFITLYADSKI